jgi:nucleoside-diphosphate-sugar epimerase
MDKLSIFGGTGFIGRNYAAMYPENNVIPRDSNTPLDNDALYLISTTHNYNVFSDVHLDINTNLNKLMDVLPNVPGTFNFVSSWFVYGDGYNSPRYGAAGPHSACNPKGFYSATKRCAEDLVESYCKTFDRNYRIMRLCNVIGGDGGAGKKKNALEYMIGRLKNNEPIEIYRGDNYRNYLHVSDVCRAMHLIMEKGAPNGIYNIGSTKSVRLVDIVEYVVKKTGSKSNVTFVDAPKFHKIVQAENFFMNCNELTALGFVPQHNTFQAIDTLLG